MVFCCGRGFSPALMNAMPCFPGHCCLLWVISEQMVPTTALSSWSWCPSPRTFGKQLRMCFWDPLYWHRGHAGVSANPSRRGLIGWKNVWIKNLISCGSAPQSSDQKTLRPQTCSGPCALVAHPHQPAGVLFFHLSLHLLVDQLTSLLPLGLVIPWFWNDSKPRDNQTPLLPPLFHDAAVIQHGRQSDVPSTSSQS